jgi:hypothetical protein
MLRLLHQLLHQLLCLCLHLYLHLLRHTRSLTRPPLPTSTRAEILEDDRVVEGHTTTVFLLSLHPFVSLLSFPLSFLVSQRLLSSFYSTIPQIPQALPFHSTITHHPLLSRNVLISHTKSSAKSQKHHRLRSSQIIQRIQ